MTRSEMITEIIKASNDLLERDDFLDTSDKEVHMAYCEWLGYDPFEVFPL